MIWGVASSLLLLFAFAIQNWRRAQVKEVKELIPNCLLTTYPLVFVSGKRSFFYFLAYWNEIPHWLASHGYEVFHLPLPWKNSTKRIRSLQNFLLEQSQAQRKFHLFLDQSSLREVKSLLEESDYSCLCSVTLMGEQSDQDSKLSPRLSIPIEEMQIPTQELRSPLFWILHLLWTQQNVSFHHLGWKLNRNQGEVLLQRTQFLAERDLLQGQRSPTL